MHGQRKGKTRKEAYENLDIKKAELLPTGEIKLPNGKIIGHRNYRHMYRQRRILPDEREAIVINKLALEYRRAKAEENGVVMVSTRGMGRMAVNEQRADEAKNGKAMQKHQKKAAMDHMQVGWKNSKTMMTFFRDRNVF